MEMAFITSFFLFVIIYLHEGGKPLWACLNEVKQNDKRLNHASFLHGSRYACELNPCMCSSQKEIFLHKEGIHMNESFHQIPFSIKNSR